MNPFVAHVTEFLGILTIIGHLIILKFLFVFFFKKDLLTHPLMAKWSLPFAWAIATIATVGSLFYSEIAMYEPCKFCWFERIFMYPLVLILALAWWKKEARVWLYTLPMAVIGAVISANHYMLQLTGNSIFPCSAVGQSVSCAKRFVLLYGYITIPLMCFTAFILIICALFIYKKNTSRA